MKALIKVNANLNIPKGLFLFGIILLFLIATYRVSFAAPIVIDHTSVDLYGDIPDYYLNQAKRMWLNFAGESHASGYRRGMALLQALDLRYPVIGTESGSPEPYRDDAIRISGLIRNQWNSWDGGAGEAKWYADPNNRSLLKNHLTYSNTHNLEIAALGFGWCWDMTWHNPPGGGIDPVYQVRWAGSSEGGPQGDLRWGLDAGDYSLTSNTVSMDTYLSATQEYEDYARANGYPTRVVFTTGPVDSDSYWGENAYQRHLKHQRIRNYVLNGPDLVLFDYADILTHNASDDEHLFNWTRGSEFGDHAGTTAAYPVIHPDNMLDYTRPECNPTCSHQEDGDHIGEVGALRLGKAIWVLAARLAGWNPDSGRLGIDLKVKDFKIGSAAEQEVKDTINHYMETP